MGLFNFAGDIIVGTLKIGGKIVVAGGKALWNAANEANDVRHSSGHMSDAELINGFKNTKNSFAERAGYMQALKDRHGK